MSKTLFVALCTVGIFALISVGTAQDTYTLSYKFSKGKTYHYGQEMKMDITQEMMGQEMRITTDARVVSNLAVDDVRADGTMILIASLDSARAAVKSPMMDTTLVLTDLLGKRTRVTVTPQGNITKRETIDTVKLQMRLRAFATRDYTNLQRLSETPVGIGGKWTSTILDSAQTDEMKTSTSATMEYTLVGKESKQGRDCLKITFTGALTTTARGKTMGMDIFTEGNGKIKGTFFFDQAAGLSIAEESSLEQELTSALTGQQNMTIPSTQKTSVTRTLLGE